MFDKIKSPQKFAALLIVTSYIFTGCSNNNLSDFEYLQRAKEAHSNGEMRAATIELKNALRINQSNFEARLLLGKIYVSLGAGAAAEKELIQAKTLGANETTWILALAEAYLIQRKASKIIKDITLTANTNKDDIPHIHAFRGEAYLLLNNKLAADKEFNKAIDISPLHPRALLGKATIAFSENRLQYAKKLVEKAIASDSTYLKSWLTLAKIEERGKNKENTRAAYLKALNLSPHNVTALVGTASLDIQSSKFETAQKNISLALTKKPKNPEANYYEAMLKLKSNQLLEAETALKNVLDSVPNHSQALLMMGEVQYLLKNFEQAESYLNKFSIKAPHNPRGAFLLGATLLALKTPKQAVNVLFKVEKPLINNVQYLSLLGSALRLSGKPKEASKYFLKATKLAPELSSLQTQLGAALLTSGELSLATDALKAASSLDSTIGEADKLLFDIYISTKDYTNALKVANNLILKEPKNPTGLNLRGSAFVFEKKHEDARKEFTNALKLNPEFAPTLLKLAHLDEITGNTNTAIKRYSNILDFDNKNEAAMLSLARLAIDAGNNNEGEKWLKKSVRENPLAIQSSITLSKLYLHNNQPLKALKIATNINRTLPNNTSILENLAQVQLAAKQTANAITTLKTYIKALPTSLNAHILLARAQLSSNDPASAHITIQNALKIHSSSPTALYLLAKMEISKNNYTKAMEIAQRLKSISPEKALGWLIEGDTLLAENKPLIAISAYKKANEDKRESKEATLKLAKLQNNTGKSSAAITTLRKWLEQKPHDSSSRMALAILLRQAKNNTAAVKEYETILEFQPRNIAALNNLAWLYLDSKDKRAVITAKKAYDLNKKDPLIIDTYGWILSQVGDLQLGLSLLKEALNAAPDKHEIRYHLASAYYKNKNYIKAKQALTHIIDNAGKNTRQLKSAKKLLHTINEEH